jgi:hypothetical protein
MGVHRLVFVGASLLIGGCAAAPTRTPAPPPAPEAATAPETAATEPPPVEMAEPPELLAAKPEQATNSGGGSEYGTSAGEKIVMGAMQMSSANTDGGSTENIAGLLGAGYFLADQHEVGAELQVTYFAPPGPNSVAFFLAPYYNFNYRVNPQLTIYGGPHLGYARFEAGNDSDDSVLFGVQAGGRYWLDRNTAAFAEWRYSNYEAFGSSTNEFAILLGLAFAF